MLQRTMNRSCWMMLLGAAIVFGNGLFTKAANGLDPALKPYEKVSALSGNLNSVGSDTLNNLMTYWAEAFQKLYPNVKMQVKGEGSATAPPALTEGTAQLGPMSRAMKDTELDAFEKKHGYKPTRDQSSRWIAWRCSCTRTIRSRALRCSKSIAFSRRPARAVSATSKPGAAPVCTGSWEKLPIESATAAIR